MPDVAAALTAPGAAVDVATGLVLAAAGAAALARGRGPLLLVAGAAWLAGDVWAELVYAHRGPLVHLLLGLSPVTALAYVDGLVPPLARSPWITLALVSAVVLAAAWRVRSAPAAARRRRVAALAGAIAVAGAPACEAIGELTGGDASALAAWWYDAAVVGVASASSSPSGRGRPRPSRRTW